MERASPPGRGRNHDRRSNSHLHKTKPRRCKNHSRRTQGSQHKDWSPVTSGSSLDLEHQRAYSRSPGRRSDCYSRPRWSPQSTDFGLRHLNSQAMSSALQSTGDIRQATYYPRDDGQRSWCYQRPVPSGTFSYHDYAQNAPFQPVYSQSWYSRTAQNSIKERGDVSYRAGSWSQPTYSQPIHPLTPLVIKGLPNNIDSQRAVDELTSLGIRVAHCKMLPLTKSKPRPVLRVDVNSEDVARLLNLSCICGSSVTVEYFISTPLKLKQCFNCQRYGHVQSKCAYEARCPHCGGQHPAWSCTKKQQAFPCINCNDLGHKATSKICPVRYKRYLQNRK